MKRRIELQGLRATSESVPAGLETHPGANNAIKLMTTYDSFHKTIGKGQVRSVPLQPNAPLG